MQVYDSSGRQVSLLNDEPTSTSYASGSSRGSSSDSDSNISSISSSRSSRSSAQQQQQQHSYRGSSRLISQTSYPVPRSHSSSPNTPELLRSHSYDSQASGDPVSPLTPTVPYEYAARASAASQYAASSLAYDEYPDPGTAKRPVFGHRDSSRSDSYDDDMTGTTSASASAGTPERAGKRYPCRFRDSHGCEKTFTTSGHASRHSKIHTAEKAVHCTFAGCQKKFTRADNMKQHLETHFKDKSRSSASHRSSSSKSVASSSSGSGARRSSTSGARANRSSSGSRSGHLEASTPSWESSDYALPTPTGQAPLASPGVAGDAWDMGQLHLPLVSRPLAARTPSGLDTLAMAVACQEGSGP